jgi:hypothetical protein
VASSFHKDLDGEAITPQAVKEAIPGFMARRGADGIQGGPIQLHHGFYDRFIKQAVGLLRLPIDEQMALVAAISLPLGRVTKMWVEPDGTTKWEGVLSQANPIARIIWQMLKENLIHLGVSLGGKIFSTQPGRDSLGQLCTLITKIRIDELSITSNPALRLTNDEGTGAYITALAKSIRSAMTQPLTKADKNSAITLIPRQQSLKLDDAPTTTGMGEKVTAEPKPTGGAKLKLADTDVKTGMGEKLETESKPTGKSELKTSDTGVTVGQIAKVLEKACNYDRKQMGEPGTLKKFGDALYGLAGVTDNPPPALINMCVFLQRLLQAASALPHMSDYQADGTIAAMTGDLTKALEVFKEYMPSDLMGKPVRPPGSPAQSTLDIVFPQQYVPLD